MAMGQTEERAIHPFFRKDFGVPTLPPPVDNGLLPTDLHACNGSPVSQTPSVAAALDHDPNAERRKRRRTDTNSADISANDITTTPNNFDESAGGEIAAPPVQTQGSCISTQVPAPSEQGQQQQPLAINATPTPGESDQKKQKVIKLNSNGKLLSSPVADRFTDKSKMKGNKRGKTGLKHTESPKSKLVVIKYINKEGLSESLGQQISEIINGQRKHVASSRAPPPPPANFVSKPAPKQPAKPTHPFFMKKPPHKTDISSQQIQCQNPITTPSEDGSAIMTERPPSRPISMPLLSFKHAFSKVPEPMHPLWPPLGLTHVRDLSDLSDQLCSQDDGNSYETDRRKSKTPAVQVNDENSVLSSIMRSTRVANSVLRLPSKQIISGRALQAEMVKRLTAQPGASDSDMVSSHGPFHPAISKLYASLPTATAAFDRGEYEAQAWTQKYAPASAQQVLCATKEALMLRDWLKHLIVSSVETGSSSKENDKAKRKEENRRKRRKKSDKLEGFIVSSDDEASEMGEISGSDDELAGDVTVSSKRTVIRTGDLTLNLKSNEQGRMTNAILLSGPPGCGKTASVYAVAKEMDFEVFEINAGHRRSAKDILDRIGDMTRNHLVHNTHDNGSPMGSRASTADPETGGLEIGKQNKLMGFFKPNSATTTGNKPKAIAPTKGVDMKQGRTQKQSLILLEEADVLFEEDKQFWSGVLTLIKQSKRPIIITCNDENLVPLSDMSFHAILRYRAPSQKLAVNYLLLVAANEGHLLKRTVVEKLFQSTGNDLRRSITELNYWCQMAVGSEKSGIDWIIDRWPQGRDLDSNGDKLRVLSENTYDDCMGWFSRDVLTSTGLTTEAELRQEALHWWQLSLQEADSMEDMQRQPFPETSPSASKLEILECLRFQSDYMESRSVLDLFAATSSLDTGKDAVDTSVSPMSEKQKLNYAEGYRLLQADHIPDYTTLTAEVGSTWEALLGRVFRQSREAELKETLENKALAAVSKPKASQHPQQEILEALAPAMEPDCGDRPANGGAELSFEHGQRSIAEDLSPYIRAIVAFDLRLEQYRRELTRLFTGDERGTKRMRTTRASRAALEGGNKAETRKERWFSPAVNVHRVMATGKTEWQDLLVQNGYFTVPVAKEQASREDSEPSSGSATDGSI